MPKVINVPILLFHVLQVIKVNSSSIKKNVNASNPTCILGKNPVHLLSLSSLHQRADMDFTLSRKEVGLLVEMEAEAEAAEEADSLKLNFLRL